jgi:hypothetical protein
VRKFLFNTAVLSALFSAFGVIQSSRKGPRDWRLALMWVAWAASLAIAIGTVVEDTKDAEDY